MPARNVPATGGRVLLTHARPDEAVHRAKHNVFMYPTRKAEVSTERRLPTYFPFDRLTTSESPTPFHENLNEQSRKTGQESER